VGIIAAGCVLALKSSVNHDKSRADVYKDSVYSPNNEGGD